MANVSTDAALVRLRALETEIATLKRKLTAKPTKRPRVVLDGIWKDFKVTNDEIEEVKRSWEAKFDDIN